MRARMATMRIEVFFLFMKDEGYAVSSSEIIIAVVQIYVLARLRHIRVICPGSNRIS